MFKRLLFLVAIVMMMATSLQAQRNQIPPDYQTMIEGHLDAIARNNEARIRETWLVITSDGPLMDYLENNLPVIRSIIRIRGLIYDLDVLEVRYADLLEGGLSDEELQTRQNRLRANIDILRLRPDIFDIRRQALLYPNDERLPNEVDANNVNSRRTELSPNQDATTNQQRATTFPNQYRRTNQDIVDDRTGR